MKIFIRCTSCQKSLSVDAANEGKKARCPACGTIFEIRNPANEAGHPGATHPGPAASSGGASQYPPPGLPTASSYPGQPNSQQSGHPTNPSPYPTTPNPGGNPYINTSVPSQSANPYQPTSVSGIRTQKRNNEDATMGWLSIALGTVTFPIIFVGCCCGLIGIIASIIGVLSSGAGIFCATRCADQTLKTIGIVVCSIALLISVCFSALQIFGFILAMNGGI